MGQFRRQTLIAVAACLGCAAARAQPAAGPMVELMLGDGFGSFTLVNRGPAVQLRSAIKVERQVDAGWQDARVTNFYLIEQCTRAPVPACITLAAGATLRPMPWLGNFCYAQCPVNCELDGPLPAGSYRFVVMTCDGTRQFASPPFQKKQ